MPIDHAIKLAITAAVKRVEYKRYNVDPDQVPDALLADIFAALFPHNPSLVSPNIQPIVHLPIDPPRDSEPTEVVAKKPRKPRAPKVTTTIPPPVNEEEENPPVDQPIISSTTEPAPPAPAPKKERKKPGPKAPKSDTPVNMKKFNPTQIKKIEKANVDAKTFMDYVNALTADAFKAKNIDEHLHDFAHPSTEEADTGAVNIDVTEVEFNGKPYFVNMSTKAVYEQQGEINKKVGYVGALEFADMEI